MEKYLENGPTLRYYKQNGRAVGFVGPILATVVYPWQCKCELCGQPKSQCYLACTATYHGE